MQSAREKIRDLERIRYVTQNYERLQGLKVLPVGVFMLMISALTLFRLDLPGMTPEEEGTLFGVLLFFGGLFGLLVAVLIGWVIGGRYERRYGKARRLRLSRRALVLIFVGTVAFYVADTVDAALPIPFYPSYLILGAAGVVFWWPERRFRSHYLAAAAVFVIVGLLPLLGVLPENYAEVPGLIFLLLGLSTIAVGLLDHLLLVRTMKQLPEEEDGRAV